MCEYFLLLLSPMDIVNHVSLYGHSGEVLCFDLAIANEHHEGSSRISIFLVSGSSSGEIYVWRSGTRRIICKKEEHNNAIIQIFWLVSWCNKNLIDGTEKEQEDLPFITDVSIVVQKKQGHVEFFSMWRKPQKFSGIEYELIPQWFFKSEFRGFTRMRKLETMLCDGSLSDMLIVPCYQETLKCLIPIFSTYNTDPAASIRKHVLEIKTKLKSEEKRGELMVFLPFHITTKTNTIKLENVSLFTGYESGTLYFWTFSIDDTFTDTAADQTTESECTLDQAFAVSEKPLLCGATNRSRKIDGEVFIAAGSMDGKIIVFKRGPDRYSVLNYWKIKVSSVCGANSHPDCSVNDMAFDNTSTHLIAATCDSQIRCFNVTNASAHCVISLPSLTTSRGLNRSHGLHCVSFFPRKEHVICFTSQFKLSETDFSRENCPRGRENKIDQFVVGGAEGRVTFIDQIMKT